MVKNRKCLCCGTKFSYCPDCSRADALKESWHSEFCSSDCMTIWTTLTKFGMDRLSKSEAKSILSEIDLNIESYVQCVKRDLAKVMEEDEESIVVPIVAEIKEVAVTVETELASRSRAKKKSHEVVTIENE